MIDKLNDALRFTQQAMNLRNKRQEILGANIANADTPNYKARDIDFASTLSARLEQASVASSSGLSLQRTSAHHIAASGTDTGLNDTDLKYRTPYQSSIDGNTVEMDAERVQFADNTVHYQADMTVASLQIKSLLAAIQTNN